MGYRNDCTWKKSLPGLDGTCGRCMHAMDDHQEDGCLGCKPTLIEKTRPPMHPQGRRPEHPNCRSVLPGEDSPDARAEAQRILDDLDGESPLMPW